MARDLRVALIDGFAHGDESIVIGDLFGRCFTTTGVAVAGHRTTLVGRFEDPWHQSALFVDS
jgi:hypothetical protein